MSMDIIRTNTALLLSMFLMKGYAAVDPVAWSLFPEKGFPEVSRGETTSVVYTLAVNPRFPGPVVLHTQFDKIGGTFAITDKCNNVTVKPGGKCQVIIQFTATKSTPSSIQMSYQYNNNVIKLSRLNTSVTEVQENVVGAISNLPTQFTLSNPEQQPVFSVTYTNKGAASVMGYAGNSAGTNLLSATPESVATVSVVAGGNGCGTINNPITLAPGNSCSISGRLTPHAVGNLTVGGLFTYNNGANTVNPTGETKVVNGSGQCQLSASTNLLFHSPTYQYSDNVLQFKFTNPCATAVTLGTVSYTYTGASSSITPGEQYDQCSNTTLATNDSCTVLVSVIPQAIGSLSVSAQVTADSMTTTATASTTVQAPGYTHKVTFINQCSFPVWYGVSQPSGSVDPTQNPSPDAYLLAPQVDGQVSAAKSITITGSYNGQFFPRTGCSQQSPTSNFICATGDCGSGANAQCPNGNVYEPYTRVEETFTSTSQGGYDVSLINGASIPAELKGLGPQSSQSSSPAAPYVCSGAGAPIQPPYTPFTPQYPPSPPPAGPNNPPLTPLGSCSWQYTAPSSSPLFNFVSNTTTVTDCSSCSSPNVCGLAFQSTPSTGNVVLACGNLLGYWTINQLCSGNVTYLGANPAMNPSTVFNCNSPITNYSTQSYPTGTTVYDIYSCTPQGSSLESCYNNNNSTCCGAVDWNTTMPYLTWETQQAYTSNTDWINGGSGSSTSRLSPTPQQSIQWLKDACPTAYSYPFDDHSSTFNCNTSDAAQQNQVNMDFEIVFCPGGVIGALSQNP